MVSRRLLVAVLLALSSAISAPLFYVVVRPSIWKYALRFTRMFIKWDLSFVDNPLMFRMPRSPSLPEFPIGLDLFCRSAWLAFLMATMWESANLFFDAFIGKVFYSKGRFLTTKQTPASQGILLSAKCDNPNGTLITGLQNRERPLTQVRIFFPHHVGLSFNRPVHSKSWHL